MYSNIEKNDLSVVQEDSYYQPNVIRLKPTSKQNILSNIANIQVSTKNRIEDELDSDKENTSVETVETKEELEKVLISETKTADLFFYSQDGEMIDGGAKPINLSPKMFDAVEKKHNLYMETYDKLTRKIDAIDNTTTVENISDGIETEEMIKEDIVNDKLDNAFAEIEKVINDSEISQSEIATPIISETTTEEVEDELNAATIEFVNLINNEVQTEKELAVSQEQLAKVTRELEEATKAEEKEIVRKYELEEAIKAETTRQKEIIKKHTEDVNSRIKELRTTKAEVDMQTEAKTSELENTNMNITSIKNTNDDLARIYNAIINSYENSYENSDEETFKKIA